MSLIRTTLKWIDEKMTEVYEEDDLKITKACGLGMIEGFLDGAVIAYPILLIGCIYWRHKAGDIIFKK